VCPRGVTAVDVDRATEERQTKTKKKKQKKKTKRKDKKERNEKKKIKKKKKKKTLLKAEREGIACISADLRTELNWRHFLDRRPSCHRQGFMTQNQKKHCTQKGSSNRLKKKLNRGTYR